MPSPPPSCASSLQIYPQVSPALVSRFREREESVRGDIFQAYVDLLRQVLGRWLGRLWLRLR